MRASNTRNPKGYRGSYLQWRENGVAPQVVFEILSPSVTRRECDVPGNRAGEMQNKRDWYERFGVHEYYEYDPNRVTFSGWIRDASGVWQQIPALNGFVSPRLGIRFELPEGEQMRVFLPDGKPFLSFVETVQQGELAERDRDDERAERRIAEAERDKERLRAERLATRLRELGIEPDDEGVS